ncbi:SGNH/GDSL hydrolase family protein [Chromobacterium violaceum]|uniref:SGNH/GDSL hydrolase family protein n=1 Tax=Chromobacterium violaceum TaxID=536 RepID=UPI001B31C777|nr:SGNH/GDSL hydrolase family protein [Chromobacterium violaceum]MBP4047294.1 SGNH/GDSL hydrolase family protein [Chromobacterium violaceum]
MKLWFIAGLGLSSLAFTNANASVLNQLPNNPIQSPFGKTKQTEHKDQLKNIDARTRTKTSFGSNTYTYVRCYYRTDTLMPTTNFEWAVEPSSNSRYHLEGVWKNNGILAWKNMFYTDITQDRLRLLCEQTLQKKGKKLEPNLIFAANDEYQHINYTIWSNDKAGQGNHANKIIAFGDSLSDTLNVYNHSPAIFRIPNRESWYLGHYSNGPLWVEHLANRLNLPLYNWATGGAGVNPDQYGMIPSVLQQVQSWQEYMKSAPNYNPASTLFTMWIGGNDLITYGNSPEKIIATQKQSLMILISAGARKVLLMKLPDISRSPVFKLPDYASSAATVSLQVTEYNQKLDRLATQLREMYGNSLKLEVFDGYTLFNDVLNNPAKYQMTNTTQSCLELSNNGSSIYKNSQKVRKECSNPNSFVFWDNLHPTTRIHQLLADRIANSPQLEQILGQR